MRDSSSKLDSAKLVGTYDVIQCRSTPANIVDIFNYAVDISLFSCSLSGCSRYELIGSCSHGTISRSSSSSCSNCSAALPAVVVVRLIFGLSCEALCVLARTIHLDMQQFAQHLFLHNSCAVSHAKVSCLSEPEICMG